MGNKLTESNNPPLVPKDLLGDIRELIEETRSAVARTVDTGLTMLYWRIGKRISEELLKGKRAEYGEEIVSTLLRQLVQDTGTAFPKRTSDEWSNLQRSSLMSKLSYR
jgi:hypothetical protein